MREGKLAYSLILPLIVILLALTVYPSVCLILNSMRSTYLADPSSNRFTGVQNYLSMLRDGRFLNALKNTLIYACFVVVVELALGLSVAILLDRNFRGRDTARALFLLPMFATPAPMAMVWRQIYDPTLGVANYFLGLVGLGPLLWTSQRTTALLSVALVDIWQWTPFFILTLSAGLASLPRDPFEAAIVDGASGFEIFRHITLPLLKPLMITTLLFRVMDAFRVYDLIYVLTEGGPGVATETLNYYAYLVSFRWLRIGYGSSLSLVLLALSLFIGMRLTRFILEE